MTQGVDRVVSPALFLGVLAAALAGAPATARGAPGEGFDRTPLFFVENRGEVGGEVAYYVEGRDQVYFTSRGATFGLNRGEAGRARSSVALDFVGAARPHAGSARALRVEDGGLDLRRGRVP